MDQHLKVVVLRARATVARTTSTACLITNRDWTYAPLTRRRNIATKRSLRLVGVTGASSSPNPESGRGGGLDIDHRWAPGRVPHDAHVHGR